MGAEPLAVTLIEVGPRDGLQSEKKLLPTPLKIELINDLVAARLRNIQVASFVSPKIVPQMSDAEELCAGILRKPGVELTALALNVKGVQRAQIAGLDAVDVSISASDTHSQKNTRKTLEEARALMHEMVTTARALGLKVRAGLQCVFGCAYEGSISEKKVLNLVEDLLTLDIQMLSLADSPGLAHPRQVGGLVKQVRELTGDLPLVLHLHDTRGLGIANLMAALEHGVRYFDTALGGLGGCPFIPGASGNIATEEVVNLLEQMGLNTGISIEKVAKWSRRLEEWFERTFPGKMHRLLTPKCQ